MVTVTTGTVLSFSEEEGSCNVLLTKTLNPDIDGAVDIDAVWRDEIEMTGLVLKLSINVGDILVAVDPSLRVGDKVVILRLTVVENECS